MQRRIIFTIVFAGQGSKAVGRISVVQDLLTNEHEVSVIRS